jgi:hypothetical protein
VITSKTITGNLALGRSVVFCPSCQAILFTWPGRITQVPAGVACSKCNVELEIVEPHGSSPAIAK